MDITVASSLAFDELAAPGELTAGFAIFLVGVLALLFYISRAMVPPWNMLNMSVLLFAILSLVFVIVAGLEFIYFWLVVAVNVVTIMLSIGGAALYG